MKTILSFMAIAFALTAPPVWAESDSAPEEGEAERKIERFLESIEYKSGEIEIGDGLAKLKVPEAFRYVGAEDARKILLLWGNPPAEEPPLGMIFPAGATPTTEDSWAIIIEWSEDGYVKDDDVEHIDYKQLLKDMQDEALASNEERVKEGYPKIQLVGWATPPRYDRGTHKMYWAKDLRFDDSKEHTLNYNIRMLGRRGVLVLNAVSSLAQLKEIEAATPQILAMVDFLPGQRYADFNPASDQVATYGLATLIAGGAAAKAGLFKGLIAMLVAGKKFVILAAVGVFATVKKWLDRRRTV